MDAALGTVVLATLAIIVVIDVVWMGLALGALLRKLGGSPVRAWIPVLRWVEAAREGRVPTVPVAEARAVEFAGALVAIISWVTMLVTDQPVPTARTALIVGLLMWLIGGVAGWLMWIDGASTIELRMRAPRAMTWLAAVAPAIWSSVLGWGSYQATGHGVTANAAAAGAASVTSTPPSQPSRAPAEAEPPRPATPPTDTTPPPEQTHQDAGSPARGPGGTPAWVTGDGGVTVAQRWEGFGEDPVPDWPRPSSAGGRAPGDEFPVDLGPTSDAAARDEDVLPGDRAVEPRGTASLDDEPPDDRSPRGDAGDGDAVDVPTSPEPRHGDSPREPSEPSPAADDPPVDSVPSQPTPVTPLPPGWTGTWARVADGEPRRSASEGQEPAFEGATEFPDVGDDGTPVERTAAEDDADVHVVDSPTGTSERPSLSESAASPTGAVAAEAPTEERPATVGASAPYVTPGPYPDAPNGRGDDAVPPRSARTPPSEPSPATAAVPRVPPPSAASPYVRRLSPYLQEQPPATSAGSAESSSGDEQADGALTSESSETVDLADAGEDFARAPGPERAFETTAQTNVPEPRPGPRPTSATVEVQAPTAEEPEAGDPRPTYAPPVSSYQATSASGAGSETLEGVPAVTPLPPPPTPVSAEPPQTDSAPLPGGSATDGGDDHTIIAARRRETWVLEVEGGASYGLGTENVVIGRSTSAAIPGRLGVDDPTRTLSKLHAELEPRDGGWWVRDLGSTNGTYLRAEDGTEREVGEHGAVVDGDLILGDLVVRIAPIAERR
ncbi:FHA domain-containing protein [Demequina sp. SO4-13]|uniref:FHA domain-containing protein n=1 Tax=Demequina sp. SO4-13 TaxID=3401027 RepID=UPI003AF6C71C